MDTKDPICGMEGRIEKHGHFFCSDKCIKVYEKKEGLSSGMPWRDIAFYGGGIVVSIILIWVLQILGWMIPFMGITFLALAGLQLLDLKGYANAFAKYDIIASRSKAYGLAYPFIEIALGLGYLFSFLLPLIAGITLIIMIIGTIGIAQNLFGKNPVKCACLGTKIKIPLTKFTLFEDIVMAIMAVMILFL